MFGLYRVCAKIPPLGKSYFKIASASIHFFPLRFFGVSVVGWPWWWSAWWPWWWWSLALVRWFGWWFGWLVASWSLVGRQLLSRLSLNSMLCLLCTHNKILIARHPRTKFFDCINLIDKLKLLH